MRLDHLLSKEEEVRVLDTVESLIEGGEPKREGERYPVLMRLWETPVPIPNTTVKT